MIVLGVKLNKGALGGCRGLLLFYHVFCGVWSFSVVLVCKSGDFGQVGGGV